MDRVKHLLSYYDQFPFEQHPLWLAVRSGKLTLDQIMKAETQHWIRTKKGQPLRKAAVDQAKNVSPTIFERLNETYVEECTDQKGINHLALIERLLTEGGLSVAELEAAVPTPGNAAAMALYADIGSRGFGCHMVAAGAIEHYYAMLSPKIFEAYVGLYAMTERQAETYRLHGPMDQEHAARALEVIDEVVDLHGWRAVESSVRDAFVATSLHYDGMLQSASGLVEYWNGGIK